MPQKVWLCLSFVLLSIPFESGNSAFSDESSVQAVASPEKELNPIDRRIYGQFLEHLYNAVNNGLWGDLVFNRSLEMAKHISSAQSSWTNRDCYDLEKEAARDGNVRYWNFNPKHAEWLSGDARNSSKYVRFNAEGSMTQNDLYYVKGEIYDWSCWVRGQGTFQFSPGSKQKEVRFSGAFEPIALASAEWTKYSGHFTVEKTTDAGEIILNFQPSQGASLDIDQISIMPRSWLKDCDGMRPDIFDAVKAINPPTIRWPGGCYASAYRWKSGIGPQDDRVSYPMEYRNDIDVNSFGTDEFIKLCRRVQAEPMIVVDLGTKEWTDRVGETDDKIDWYQDVCDWVEYCNGSIETTWGARRAAAGHPEPYRVLYWEIDNEVNPNTTTVEEYVKIIRDLVPRMKAICPYIKVIVSGSWNSDKIDWDRQLIHDAGNLFDYLSTHHYANPEDYASEPMQIQEFFDARRSLIRGSEYPDIRVYHSEWNAQSIDWRNGLYAAGFLIAAERSGDIVTICSPCLFLRGTKGADWNNSLINFDNKKWFPAPNYVVMKLWHDHYAPTRVELSSDAPELRGNKPALNAIATKSADGKTVYVKIVNTSANEFPFDLSINGREIVSQNAQTVTPAVLQSEETDAKLYKQNSLDHSDIISVKPLRCVRNGAAVQVRLPSYSATVVAIKTK